MLGATPRGFESRILRHYPPWPLLPAAAPRSRQLPLRETPARTGQRFPGIGSCRTLFYVDGAALLITGLGLAAAAGLNAYIPLLVAGVLIRLDVLNIGEPYDLLGSWPAIILLSVLLAVEVLADKIPGVDSLNDTVQTLVRPASGAVLFAGALAPDSEWTQALGLIAGLVTAGSVHAAKASARPVANVSTGGVAAPVLSTVEDIASFGIAILAIFAPLIMLVVLVALVWLLWRMRRHRQKHQEPIPVPDDVMVRN